jgi:nicotinamidase-related amidase
MKTETYLTEENRSDKVIKWFSSMDKKRKWGPEMGKSALLILDMQKFFIDPQSHAYIPSSDVIIPVISTIVELFNGPIFLTRHTQPEDDSNLMTEWWKDRIEGEPSQLHPEISKINGKVVLKEHYSAFHDTNLHQLLDELSIGSLIITGVMTDLCCETTARDAFMRGFKVYFVADGTASATEQRHVNALKTIATGFGEVISSKELLLQL